MSQQSVVTSDEIRIRFTRSMSDMYRTEVPQYGTLMDRVADVNGATLEADPALRSSLKRTDDLSRISLERHGAIRLGTPEELFTMRRLFAVMGMVPVGYYDLSVAGVPVHSTAFRPVHEAHLARNPFRVFTSLLRLELIEDEALRAEAAATLSRRRIFTDGALALIDRFEQEGGLTVEEADRFVREALETFRWHRHATVDADTFRRLTKAHRLIADVVSFKGPHINHLTPRTLDIDAVQRGMPKRGITPKDVIEGPPPRRCPILLHQTSFKALEEPIVFRSDVGEVAGTHAARFGEIEQRGLALTRKGRALYDELLSKVRDAGGQGNARSDYVASLQETFGAFPDDYATIRKEGLGFFREPMGCSSSTRPDGTRRRTRRAEHHHPALLPPRASKLNPQERIWQFKPDNWLSNPIFADYDDIVGGRCWDAWNKLVEQPWIFMSVGLRDWAYAFGSAHVGIRGRCNP